MPSVRQGELSYKVGQTMFSNQITKLCARFTITKSCQQHSSIFSSGMFDHSQPLWCWRETPVSVNQYTDDSVCIGIFWVAAGWMGQKNQTLFFQCSELGQKPTSNNGLEKPMCIAAFELYLFSSLYCNQPLFHFRHTTHQWWSFHICSPHNTPPPPSDMSLAWQCQSMDGCQIF